jgi:hypothetical protein
MSNGTQDIVKATARGRVLSIAVFVLALAIIALFQFVTIPVINATLAGNPTPETASTLKWIFAGFAALAVIPSAAMIFIGRKIVRANQYPLANAWVWRDTPIQRGDRARRMGKLCITSGTFAGIVCLALIAYIWTVFDRLSFTPQLRPGVTVLQAPTAKPPAPATVK